MPVHENDSKELNDRQPPKSPMTIYEWAENLDRQNERPYKKVIARINSLSERIEKEQSELMAKLTQAVEKIAFTDSKRKKQKELTEELTQLKEENVQLKQENVQLKEEITTLKSQIQYLWKLFTSFLAKKITGTSEFWNAFFAKNKDSAPAKATEEQEHSNTLS
jgi:chromosome segregation ATPase